MNTDERADLQVVESSTLATIIDAEIDRQVATAKRWPRDLATIRKNVEALTCANSETAAQMFFKLPPRGDEKKEIEGEGIRLAEIMLGQYGNLKVGQRITGIQNDTITAQAVVWDLENNISFSVEETRSIRNKEGQRYKQDMIILTGRAAMSIALRNAIFKAIPKALFSDVITKIKRVATGADTGVPVEKRFDVIANHFRLLGVDVKDVLACVDKKTRAEITEADLEILVGLKTAIADKETTVQEVFGSTPRAEAQQRQADVHSKMGDLANAKRK